MLVGDLAMTRVVGSKMPLLRVLRFQILIHLTPRLISIDRSCPYSLRPTMRWASCLFLVEDYIVGKLLQSSTFQRGVRRVHQTVHNYKHGRNPDEPLREGEATRKPTGSRLSNFMLHFIRELRSQARGTTTNPAASSTMSHRPK
ncbi:hypothetical protein GGR54DRAFT_403067 [Hypoxylon sp. NC1633]|nr:hypothetical protein GGR54DRAFT_403067 [Hypoxylon sp. NC1633]